MIREASVRVSVIIGTVAVLSLAFASPRLASIGVHASPTEAVDASELRSPMVDGGREGPALGVVKDSGVDAGARWELVSPDSAPACEAFAWCVAARMASGRVSYYPLNPRLLFNRKARAWRRGEPTADWTVELLDVGVADAIVVLVTLDDEYDPMAAAFAIPVPGELFSSTKRGVLLRATDLGLVLDTTLRDYAIIGMSDVNGDGRLDVATYGPWDTWVDTGREDGAWVNATGPALVAVATGDGRFVWDEMTSYASVREQCASPSVFALEVEACRELLGSACVRPGFRSYCGEKMPCKFPGASLPLALPGWDRRAASAPCHGAKRRGPAKPNPTKQE